MWARKNSSLTFYRCLEWWNTEKVHPGQYGLIICADFINKSNANHQILVFQREVKQWEVTPVMLNEINFSLGYYFMKSNYFSSECCPPFYSCPVGIETTHDFLPKEVCSSSIQVCGVSGSYHIVKYCNLTNTAFVALFSFYIRCSKECTVHGYVFWSTSWWIFM